MESTFFVGRTERCAICSETHFGTSISQVIRTLQLYPLLEFLTTHYQAVEDIESEATETKHFLFFCDFVAHHSAKVDRLISHIILSI